jgi:hypothetical protein
MNSPQGVVIETIETDSLIHVGRMHAVFSPPRLPHKSIVFHLRARFARDAICGKIRADWERPRSWRLLGRSCAFNSRRAELPMAYLARWWDASIPLAYPVWELAPEAEQDPRV